MSQDQHFAIIKKTTRINALVNALLAIAKIIIGYIGLSHALLADGVHSLTDLIGDGFVIMAARLGAQSPDDDHPYGHRRIETLAAIVIALLLVLVGIYIVYDAVQHVLTHTSAPVPEFYVIITAIISIFINEALYRYGKHYGEKINSQLIISNAWHNRSDAYVSLVVVVSVGATLLGVKHLDVIGAIIIGILILYAGSKMIYHSFSELIDTGVDLDTIEAMKTTIAGIDGVETLHQLRTRLHGGAIHADVHIQVNPRISVSEGHYIGEQVHMALINNVKNVHDVTVHIDPEDDETNQPCVHLPNRSEIEITLNQAWNALPEFNRISDRILHYHDGQIDISVYFDSHDIDHHISALYQEKAKAVLNCIANVNLYHKL